MPDTTLEQFEAEATSFLDSNASLKAEEKKFVWGEGSDKVAMSEERNRTDESNDLHRACDWRAKKFDAGFGWITGPPQYGGRGLPGAYEKAFNALEAQYQVPNQAALTIGGPDAATSTEQSSGGEDFAWYLEHVPGAMARLGVWSGSGPMRDIHQPTFDLDERALPFGVRVLTRAALSALTHAELLEA